MPEVHNSVHILHSRYSDILRLFDTIHSVSPEDRIHELCAALAAEHDPEQLIALLRQLEFAIAESALDLQNRAIVLNRPSGISAAD